jgi:hypothetical protein
MVFGRCGANMAMMPIFRLGRHAQYETSHNSEIA